MKKITILFSTLILSAALQLSCENKDNSNDSFDNSQYDAEIIGFVSEKCYCCWGWEIKIDDTIIKADSLPDVSAIGYLINHPIPVIIETGEIKVKCGNGPNYYKIKTLTIK